MRIWDIDPGYLNRQSLLGEHRELHGIVSILTNDRKGYANHPETLRWKGYGWALRQRHRLLSAEMALRGYTDRSPVRTRSCSDMWPAAYIDPPFRQYRILASKYENKAPGRIPLPENAQALWRQHKYSVLARDPGLYKRLGRQLARVRKSDPGRSGTGKSDALSELADSLVMVLRKRPPAGGLRNALQHMWGHVGRKTESPGRRVGSWSAQRLLKEIRLRALTAEEPYLLQSTALGELGAWIT